MAGQKESAPGLGQCEITGLWYPQDELVTIEGYVVSADGKPELLNMLRRGEPVGNTIERPSVGQRFGAMFVDGLIIQAVTKILELIIGAAAPVAGQSFMAIMAGQAKVTLVSYICWCTYLTVMHGRNGQTVGKMVAKIKVVQSNGADISMKTAFLRTVYYMGIFVVTMSVFLAGFEIIGLAIMSIGAIVNLVSTIMALADGQQQRALHDRLAGTRVIRVK